MIDTTRPNRLARALGKLDKLPGFVRPWVRNRVLRRAVPLTGTTRLQYVQLTPQRVEMTVANTRRVQNHIGGVHAAAMALLAETATGFVVGMNVPDDKVPVIKTMKVDFQRRAVGALKAVASLQAGQITLMQEQDKGETIVSVVITDESGQQPIQAEMLWAWVPKRR